MPDLTLANATAEEAIDAMIREPAEAESHNRLAFAAVWRVLAGTTVPKRTRADRTSGRSRHEQHHTHQRLAEHGTVVLGGRDPDKLRAVEAEIAARPGGRTVSVVADLSDPADLSDTVCRRCRSADRCPARQFPIPPGSGQMVQSIG
ncbi:hypothetical protein [Kitasatospora sp. GAS204B]|uniref:hypothetical protein n=1 Tax=unclassified Kitasatospora TaxID=2633591 RepID=UPI0024735C20|nr:hypothetical protein [Kitasatospora sp. GAS204B]MDH6121422.1 hypothetical protein [Kitasatospora sp. GAS204B]